MNSCCVCSTDSKSLKLSCQHHICLKCASETIRMDNQHACPKCGSFLANDIGNLFMDYMKDPDNSFEFNFGFKTNDVVWTYSGANGNNWAFSADQCKTIENAYAEYLTDGTKKEFKLNVTTGSWYVLDFDAMQQYSFNDNTKRRTLDRFELESYKDLADNHVVGVAGKKI